MSGHRHNPTAATQNQGNSLGDRSCVRQSKLYRQYESGNDVKAILGSGHLAWDPNVKQGAYAGQKVYDHIKDSTYDRYEPQSNYGSQGNYGRQNNENDYYSKNSLSQYAKQDDRNSDPSKNYRSNGGNSSNRAYYDQEYTGGRGASSGGGASSFSIGQSDYSSNSNADHRRRRDYDPPSNPTDTYPMNKMGNNRSNSGYRTNHDIPDDPYASNRNDYPLNKMGNERSNSGYRNQQEVPAEDSFPLNKMGSDSRAGSGYRSLKDQMEQDRSGSGFRRKSSEYAAEAVARTYFQPNQERSTRPW